LLIELYETEFGICNHLNTTNPLSSVQFNDCENYIRDGIYEQYLTAYIYREVYKKLGMTFEEWIDQPRYKIESQMNVLNEYDKKKQKIQEDTLETLESSTKSSKSDISFKD
jgi:hypothetical protein